MAIRTSLDFIDEIKKPLSCPICESVIVCKSGLRYNKKGVVQLYKCRKCGSSFTPTKFQGSRVWYKVIQYAINLYQLGLSLEAVSLKLRDELGLKISRQTVRHWLIKANVSRRKRDCGNHKAFWHEEEKVGVSTTITCSTKTYKKKTSQLNAELKIQAHLSKQKDKILVLTEFFSI